MKFVFDVTLTDFRLKLAHEIEIAVIDKDVYIKNLVIFFLILNLSPTKFIKSGYNEPRL